MSSWLRNITSSRGDCCVVPEKIENSASQVAPDSLLNRVRALSAAPSIRKISFFRSDMGATLGESGATRQPAAGLPPA